MIVKTIVYTNACKNDQSVNDEDNAIDMCNETINNYISNNDDNIIIRM